MPAPQFLALTPPSLPPGYCYPATPQEFLNDIFAGAFATIPGSLGIGFNYGSAIPPVNDQGKPWVRLNPDGSLNGVYSFAFGTWVRPYAIPAGPNDFRAIWFGTLADLYSFDGGDGVDPNVTPTTPSTGSFWQEDTDVAARTLVGVGTLPISGTVLSVGDLAGLEKVGLISAEMPPHTHAPQAEEQAGKPQNKIWGSDPNSPSGGGGVYPSNDGLASIGTVETPINTTLANTGGDTSVTPVVVKPHENMPPFIAFYCIKRTGRSHHTI